MNLDNKKGLKITIMKELKKEFLIIIINNNNNNNNNKNINNELS